MRGQRVLWAIAMVACQGSTSSTPAPSTTSGSSAPSTMAGSASPTDDADIVRTSTSGAVTYTYRASRMTYLVYTLDCLAELVPCSQHAFDTAWRAGGSREDDEAIAAWKELRRRYSGMITDRPRVAQSALPIPYHDRDVGTAVRIAGFGARDVADLGSRLSLFLGAAEVAKATKIAEQFAPRIAERWRSERAAVIASLDDYVALGNRADVQAVLGPVATFFAIGTSGAHQTFDLVSRPPDEGPTSAQQLGELAVVEVVAGENAASRYSVIAHEMFHAWFGASSIEAQVALVDRFVASGDPLAGPAWGLLDEVLATALGNGLVARVVSRADYERRLQQDGGFYNDPFIDKVAKALLPALEKRLANNGTVFDPDFVPEYLAAVHAAFPDGLPPIAYLRPMFLAIPGASASDKLMDLARPGYSESYSTVEESIQNAARLQGWGTAIFTRRADLDRLGAFLPRTTIAAVKQQATKPVVFAWQRKPIGTVFLFVADEPGQLDPLVTAFAALKAPMREGVIVR